MMFMPHCANFLRLAAPASNLGLGFESLNPAPITRVSINSLPCRRKRLFLRCKNSAEGATAPETLRQKDLGRSNLWKVVLVSCQNPPTG
jgi:hypothetical protein